MEVPFFDLKAQNEALGADLQDALASVMSGGHFILGPAVESFERHFAEYLGTAQCVGLNNGTSALHLALQCCGVGPGDEVVTTPLTWVSTAWAISYVGARPVFADVDPVTRTLDPAAVEHALTSRTKAILPVHLYGQAANLGALGQLAGEHKLALVEDAAQAHGARFGGRRIGTFGRAGCFSFYPSKNLGAFGEAGAVVTDDTALANRVRQLRDHAQAARHHHIEVGYNMRMEGIQGAVLDVKLRHLDAWNARRAAHAARYRELLGDIPELDLPAATDPGGHVWHLFVVVLREGDRDSLRRDLAARGVTTGVHYPTPVHLQPAYARLGYRRGDFPHAEWIARQCLSLPMFPELTNEQVEHTAQSLRISLKVCQG